MANNAVLNTVYNQYLTTYAPQRTNSRYDTHKRSELKNVYNSMVKVNRDAPLYKFENSNESREYVIGLKEESRVLRNGIMSVIGDGKGAHIGRNIAFSTDERVVFANYVGADDIDSVKDATLYEIEVKDLATPQVNLGAFLPKDKRDITPGPYSFDITVGTQAYEFQYNIKEDESNFDIQSKLCRLINNAGIRLAAEVLQDEEGNSALKIESAQLGTGAKEQMAAFVVTDSIDSKVTGSVSYLGIDHITREAMDATMIINGQTIKSSSNTFLLNNEYEITLNGLSPHDGISTTVGLKADTEAIVENIGNLIRSYNSFISAMDKYSSSSSRKDGLMLEMSNIVDSYKGGMSSLGISVADNGTLDYDENSLSVAVQDSSNADGYNALKSFSASVLRKSNQISLNPIAYMNKTIVAYKNPGRNYIGPYTASAYSGLLFNSYC